MSTTTPRLQLTKPLGSESMILGASQLNDAYSKIDAAVGVKKFATQGAATAVFSGDMILETSTGQSKLFNSPNWMNIFDPNNGKGIPQEIDTGVPDDIVFATLPEFILWDQLLNVEAGRKYLVNFNLNTSAEIGGTGAGTQQGYARLTFKYTTALATDPNIFIHDVATYIAAVNSSKSKSFKGMFEFFPNVTAVVKMAIFGFIATGNQDLKLNLTGSTPDMYMTDWGV